jgi:hypothetical protein
VFDLCRSDECGEQQTHACRPEWDSVLEGFHFNN